MGKQNVESYVPAAAFYEGKRELAGEAFSDRFAVLDLNGAAPVILAARGRDLAPGAILPLTPEDRLCAEDAARNGGSVLIPSGVGAALLFGDAAADGLIPALFPEADADLTAQAFSLMDRPEWRVSPSFAKREITTAKRAHAISEVCRDLAEGVAACERLFDPERAARFRSHSAEVAAFAGCRVEFGEMPRGKYPLSGYDRKRWTLLLLCLFLSLRGASAKGPTLRMREESRDRILTGMEYRSNADTAKRDPERFAFLDHPAFRDIRPEKTRDGYRFSLLLRSDQTGGLRSVQIETRVRVVLTAAPETA